MQELTHNFQRVHVQFSRYAIYSNC